MNITEICIRRPVLAWMIMASTIVFGIVAATRIGVSQYPDVDYPNITVSVSWEGASPEAVENDIISPLEEALVQVEGVKSMTSSSRQGAGRITVEMELSRSVDNAMQDVQSKVSAAQRRLPKDADPPVISKSNPEDQPIMWIGLSGPYSPQILSDFTNYRVKERLQTVPGVGEVTMGGSRERMVRIWIDAKKLNARGLTINEVTQALQREHVEMPAGRLEVAGREVNIRVLGEAIDLDTLRQIVVHETQGAPVYLHDVALVEDGFADERRRSRVDGAPAQGLGIRKQRGANAVSVAEGVHAALDEIQKTLPDGMVLGINFDSTRFIEESITEIEFEILLAVVLTAIVCWMFLGSWSSTLNVILAIPMSLLGTVAIIYFLGFTLNTFTLLALGLAVGIVVDDAIMVLENIYRHAEGGKHRVLAARDGTNEISFAALAATLAVCAIFLPVVFMDGVIGYFFLQFGVTLCIAVLLSYVEAITLAPARCAQLLKTGKQERSGVGRVVDRGFASLERLYARVLNRSLKVPVLVLIVGAVTLGGAMWLFNQVPSEFVPSQDQSRLMIRMQTAVGSSLDETDVVASQAERILLEHPDVERAYVNIGGFGGNANQAMVFLTLVPPDERDKTQQELVGELRRKLNAFPGLRTFVQDPSQSGFGGHRGYPLEFSIRGPEFSELVRLSEEAKVALEQSGLAVDIDSDYELGMPELRIAPDRARAADLGVPVDAVAQTINALVGGARIGKFSSGGRRLDIRTRLLADQRTRPEDIGRLYVRSRSGELVPLSALVKWEEVPALQQITRLDRERAVSVFANIAAGHAQDEAIAFVERLNATLPPGYHLALSGASVTYRESMSGLIFALVLGILVAYMILAAQFNSFLDPVTVLTILPLSLAGAIGALWVSGNTLNIFSMIGLLLLMGIVKKNSIILVDYANQMRDDGLETLEAIRKAGPIRLRPILMTSIATGMAALPATLALGPGSEVRAPMSFAIIGGLLVSTILSLLVVPAFYIVSDRVSRKLGFKRREMIELDTLDNDKPPVVANS